MTGRAIRRTPWRRYRTEPDAPRPHDPARRDAEGGRRLRDRKIPGRPGAPLRFKRGPDATSSYVASFEEGQEKAPAKLLFFRARPERGGCRLEASIAPDNTLIALLPIVTPGVLALVWHLVTTVELQGLLVIAALLIPPLALLRVALVGTGSAAKLKEPQLVQEVVAAFEPIRRKSLGYREPAASLPPGATE